MSRAANRNPTSNERPSSAAHVDDVTGSDTGGDDADDVLNVRDVMVLLKLGRGAVYDACGRNEIPHRRIGKHIRFSRVALLRWLEGAR